MEYTEVVAESLQFQETPAGLFVRAEGHITAAISADLRELVLDRLSRPPVPLQVAVDLQLCDYMDSTFMGLLVGFHKRFKVLTGRPLTILRPSQECVKLLTGLGILKLMHLVVGDEPPSPLTWQTVHHAQKASPEIILRAHQNLSELSDENAQKFHTLESILEQQVPKKP